MFGHYSKSVLATLLLMILSTAARTIITKVYFQLGYDDPILVLVLILISHGFAIPIYFAAKVLAKESNGPDTDGTNDDGGDEGISTEKTKGEKPRHRSTWNVEESDSDDDDAFKDDDKEVHVHATFNDNDLDLEMNCKERSAAPQQSKSKRNKSTRGSSVLLVSKDWKSIQQTDISKTTSVLILAEAAWIPECAFDDEEQDEALQDEKDERPPTKNRITDKLGSVAGLTEESEKAVLWVHKLPHWSYPVISSVINLLDIFFRITALLYLQASVATMMFSGLELVASIFAAKFVRKRTIMIERWFGGGIMVLGLLLVGLSDFVGKDNASSSSGSENFALGMLFVILKVIMGVAKGLAQELFMQVALFPATLLLGLEGVYGVLISLPLYFALGPRLVYHPIDSFRRSFGSAQSVGYTLMFMAVVLFAGIYSLLATCFTSAMTKNMWKNFRGLVVWIAAMIIYYVSGNASVGEPWSIPGSLFILVGFSIMMGAIYVYYGGVEWFRKPTFPLIKCPSWTFV